MNIGKSAKIAAHINPNLKGRGQSATLAINALTTRLQAGGRTVYKFGLGQSPFPVPPQVVKALQVNAHQKDYLPVRGLPALCEAVAAYHQRTQGLTYDADDIMVGPGSKELMFILQLAYNGSLLLPAPSWVSYGPQAEILGRTSEWLKTDAKDDWCLTPEILDRHCQKNIGRPRLLILNYPNNPTGVSYTQSQLQALAEVARAHHILLLSDEIYGELDYKGGHTSIARYYPEGTIVSGGLSKWCGAGGWRLGIFAFPKQLHWLRDAMAVVASETFTSTSAPIQYAAVNAFNGGTEIDRYLKKSRYILSSLADWIYTLLQTTGIKVARPDGAFYMFPDFSPFKELFLERGIPDIRRMCEGLLRDTGVALLPGTDFGRSADEWVARMAFVDFDGAAALDAVDNMSMDGSPPDGFLQLHFAHLLDGVEKMCKWTIDG